MPTALPTIDLTSVTASDYNNAGIFGWTNHLHTIEKIIIKDDGTTPFYTWFTNATALVNVTFEGVIGKNGLDFSYSPLLSHDSLMNVINCLKDYSGTSGYTVTLGATNLAKLTDSEKAIATQKGWTLA